jgi:hypothetical protein
LAAFEGQVKTVDSPLVLTWMCDPVSGCGVVNRGAAGTSLSVEPHVAQRPCDA